MSQREKTGEVKRNKKKKIEKRNLFTNGRRLGLRFLDNMRQIEDVSY